MRKVLTEGEVDDDVCPREGSEVATVVWKVGNGCSLRAVSSSASSQFIRTQQTHPVTSVDGRSPVFQVRWNVGVAPTPEINIDMRVSALHRIPSSTGRVEGSTVVVCLVVVYAATCVPIVCGDAVRGNDCSVGPGHGSSLRRHNGVRKLERTLFEPGQS